MSVLVCVTGQKSCERLIVMGSRLAAQEKQPLVVMHVARSGDHVLGYKNEAEALEYLFGISSQYGADMFVKKSDDVVSAIEREAKDRKATVLVAGRASNYSGWDLLDELRGRLPDVRFEIQGA